MSLTKEQQKLVDDIMQEFEDSKTRYKERELLEIGHIKYVVVSPNCLKIGSGSLRAGESYDKEEARRIFFEVWGYDNGKPMCYPSGLNFCYVYPSNFEDEILEWLTEEDDSLHWSGRLQKGRHSR